MGVARLILALDVGDRRIGVATASLEARIASPLLTLDRKLVDDVFATISNLLQEQQAQAVVVGLPRGLDGQETTQTTAARTFAEELKRRCLIPVYLQDEALTSVLARDQLESSGKPYSKADIDKLAAAHILQDWLANAGLEVRA